VGAASYQRVERSARWPLSSVLICEGNGDGPSLAAAEVDTAKARGSSLASVCCRRWMAAIGRAKPLYVAMDDAPPTHLFNFPVFILSFQSIEFKNPWSKLGNPLVWSLRSRLQLPRQTTPLSRGAGSQRGHAELPVVRISTQVVA
jgi:hypothetical protein